MPELPEVRTVVAALKNRVLGRKITKVSVFWPNIAVDELSVLENEVINDIRSHGKLIIIELSKHYLLVHLRMEGKFYIKPYDELKGKHEHVIFYLDNNETLRYDDTRKFGKMYVREAGDLYDTKPMIDIGKEPFDIEKTSFYDILKSKTEMIKIALLDQHIMSGLGNIYADEVLFLSGILPTRKSNEITKKEAFDIVDNACLTLTKAIKLGGTTIHTYNSMGISGLFQNQLLVHTKKGQPCPKCGRPVEKIKVGGRGTYVCFSCQK